ncbi:MAG: helix-hairpin-helix domain-containing protein [Candidatus Humimicrobiaceae bacterium]
MRFRDFANKIVFKFLSFRNEKGRQFYLSVFILIFIAIIILSLLTIKQNHGTKVKENILKSVLNSSQDTDNSSSSKNPSSEDPDITIQKKSIEKIMVYICGEINQAGVYEIDKNMRIIDLIELAGGAKTDAFLESINLAEILTDSQKVYIPSKLEAAGYSSNDLQNGISGGAANSRLVNINFAGLNELELLPGIGPELAQRIIDYRNNAGSFKSKEDLKNVTGIGEKKFEAIKDFITI